MLTVHARMMPRTLRFLGFFSRLINPSGLLGWAGGAEPVSATRPSIASHRPSADRTRKIL
jgi:hypothetical protein